MNITIEKKPNCEAELHIEVESGVVRDRRKSIVERYQKLAKVPGFRPGHVPATVIEKKFAREIDGELREALVSDGCSEAAKENKLSVISVRTVRGDTFQPDGNFTFTADLTLEPGDQPAGIQGNRRAGSKGRGDRRHAGGQAARIPPPVRRLH